MKGYRMGVVLVMIMTLTILSANADKANDVDDIYEYFLCMYGCTPQCHGIFKAICEIKCLVKCRKILPSSLATALPPIPPLSTTNMDALVED